MSKMKRQESYKPCRECGFLVMAEDTYCPNCGIITPLWTIPSVHLQLSKYSMLVSGGIYCLFRSLLALWHQSGAQVLNNLWGTLKESVVVGIFFGLSMSMVKFFFDRAKQRRLIQALQRRSTSSLRNSEKAIEQRLAEINTRKEQIKGTLQEIGRIIATEQAQRMLGTLKSSLAALQIQRDRYTVKLWEIMLIRWYNTLKPLTEKMGHLTYEICHARIHGMTDVIKRGTEMLQAWENDPSLTQAKQQCILRLRKALDACEQVHRDLLSHKAALAVQGVSPLDEQVPSAPAVITSLEELDVFSILPDVGEFTSGLKALETEYFRLKGEEEVYREFEI